MISADEMTTNSEKEGTHSPTPSVDSVKPPSNLSKECNSSSTSSPNKNEPAPSTTNISYPYHISPSTIPGILHFGNNGAIDWSLNGLIAYGCQNRIVVVDTAGSLSYCTTLHRHKHVVSLVKWSPAVSADSQLASVDSSGVIIVWNVLESTPLTVILASNDTKVVHFFQWITLDKNLDGRNENSLKLFNPVRSSENRSKTLHDVSTFKSSNLHKTSFLLTFYQQTNSFILYDAELGEPVIKWQVDSKVSHIAFNPFFTFNRACDSSVYNLLLGFKAASSSDEKLYFGLARINENDFLADDHSSKEAKKLTLPFVPYVMQSFAGDSSNQGAKSNRSLRYDLITRLDQSKLSQHLASVTEATHSTANTAANTGDNYIQLEYHKSIRNQVFIVFSREIYLVDLSIETIINVIPLERNCSKLVKIFSCSTRNSFYAFHETGNVSFRLYQKKVIHDRSNIEMPDGNISVERNPSPRPQEDMAGTNQASFLNVGYINLCQSESIRLTKQNKIYGYSMSPFDEARVAFLLSSGRIVIKSLICQKVLQSEAETSSMGYIVNQSIPVPCLSDLIKPQEYQLGAFLLSDNSSHQKSFDSIFYKILSTQFISGLNSLPTVIRQTLPLTLQNIKKHRPLLAVGDSLGLIQIWLLHSNTCSLYREFSVHSYPLAGIEWTSLSNLISFAFPTINSPSHSNHSVNSPFSALSNFTGSGSSSGRVTNELYSIDIETGKVTPFRTNRIQDSSPIETIRVSHLKQYLIILFKNEDPFEIWDVKSLSLLRVMSKNMSNITAVEWSPLYNKKQVSRNSEVSDSDNSQKSTSHVPVKENFIVTNRNLFHFSIEGNLVREMSCIPPDQNDQNVNVTSIAWKSDQVLLGDASGTLNLWHLKRKISATEPTFRGYIRKIKFAPGRQNMKCLILYADYGVDIWDINDSIRVCAQLKYPRDISFKIIDVDWASCDLPILCSADGFIFVTDTKLKTYSSSIGLRQLDKNQLKQLFLFNEDSQVESMFNLQIDSNFSFINLNSKKDVLRQSMFCIPYTLDKAALEGEHSGSADSFVPQIDVHQYIRWQLLLAKMFASTSDYDFWSIVYSILFGEELDSRLDLFFDTRHYREKLQEKLLLLEANRKTYSHACHAYQLNLRLKNFQRAVQILLETESFQNAINGHGTKMTHENVFYVDALKACLITSLQSDMSTIKPGGNKVLNNDILENADLSDNISIGYDDNSESSLNKGANAVAPVVKLVATSLIANGHILEGVELLNFISKTADSCRYLQSADKWLDSIWLAKANLDANECTEIIRRWCEQLIASKYYSDQQTAIKMYLSRRQFSRVLRSLNRLSELKAFPFALVCVAAQLIEIQDYQDLLEEIFDTFVIRFFGYDETQLASLKGDGDQSTLHSADGGDSGDPTLSDSSRQSNYEEVLRQCWAMFSGKALPK